MELQRGSAPPWTSSISDFVVGEELGRGGFGTVHRARRISDGSEVAIKVIDKALMRAGGLGRRVASEVEVHWQLDHSGVVKLLGCFEDASAVFLVTELCGGGELFGFLQARGRPLSEAETRGVAAQLVRALRYLHSHGIIHRDLKLSNVLLTDSLDVKLADFGLAVKTVSKNSEQQTMCGTPNYISPEIVSRQPYGLAADIWSLGCMLVTMLTGTPPFESPAVKNTLDKVSRVEYTLPAHLSIEAKDLIRRLLQKDPRNRLPLDLVLTHPFFDSSLPIKRLTPIHSSSARVDHIPRRVRPTSNTEYNKPHSSHRPVAAPLQENRAILSNKSSRNNDLGSNLSRMQISSNDLSPSYPASQHNKQLKACRSIGVDPSSFRVDKENYNPTSSQTQSSRIDKENYNPNSSHNPLAHQSAPRSIPTNASVVNIQEIRTINAQQTVPKLDTSRLKPVRQSTKHGAVEVLESGRIALDFLGEKNLIIITGDGSQIMVYDRSTSPLDVRKLSSIRPLTTYTHHELPSSLSKKYRYAQKFVHLVRSKTPKIIYYSPQAKCMLMENSPHPDFEAVFYNGTKIHTSTTKNTLEIKVPIPNGEITTHRLELGNFQQLELPSELVGAVKHVQECLKQCLEIERNESGAGNQEWPVVLKTGGMIAARDGGAQLTSACPPSLLHKHHHASSASAAIPKLDDHKARSVPSTYQPLTPATRIDRYRSAASDSAALTRRRADTMGATADQPSTTSHDIEVKQRDLKFIDGVGWCYKQLDGVFVLLFLDGVNLVVEGRDQCVVWNDFTRPGDMGLRLPIDKNLPHRVKVKLSSFPKFLKLYQVAAAAPGGGGGTTMSSVASAA